MNATLLHIADGFRTFTFSTWIKNLVDVVPPSDWHFRALYVGMLALFLVVGVIIAFLRIPGEYKGRWLNFLFGNLAIGLVIYFFRTQRIPYLGMDLIRFLSEVGMLVWLNNVIWYGRTMYRHQKLQQVVVDRRSKYLPKPKRNA